MLEVFDNHSISRILHVRCGDCVLSVKLRRHLRHTSILPQLVRRRFRWFGHAARSLDGELIKNLLVPTPPRMWRRIKKSSKFFEKSLETFWKRPQNFLITTSEFLDIFQNVSRSFSKIFWAFFKIISRFFEIHFKFFFQNFEKNSLETFWKCPQNFEKKESWNFLKTTSKFWKI